MIFYPFTPTKAQEFILYFGDNNQTNNADAPNIGTFLYVGISKDGGTFDATTNSPVEITSDTDDGNSGARSRSRYKITLTATEMDADTIIITLSDGSMAKESIVIYTTGATGIDTPGSN